MESQKWLSFFLAKGGLYGREDLQRETIKKDSD